MSQEATATPYDKAIKTLVWLAENSQSEDIRLEAAKELLKENSRP